MKYLKLINGKVIEAENIDALLIKYTDSVEVTKDEAYMFLFEKISHRMGAQFSNYNHIDIASEVYYMLLKTYKTSGLYAPDKPYEDNCRIWWSIAKKDCLYIIKKYKNKTKLEDLVEDIPENSMIKSDYDIEGLSVCAEIIKYMKKLSNSDNNTEQNMGFYGLFRLKGLSDKKIAEIFELSIPRVYEIRRSLKNRLYRVFKEVL